MKNWTKNSRRNGRAGPISKLVRRLNVSKEQETTYQISTGKRKRFITPTAKNKISFKCYKIRRKKTEMLNFKKLKPIDRKLDKAFMKFRDPKLNILKGEQVS